MKGLKSQLISDYNEGKPSISDEEYDALFSSNNGKDSLGSKGNKLHYKRLGSIRKIYEGEDNIPEGMVNAIKSPKLDGIALSLTYFNGKLISAATRGDGTSGTDVTEKILVAQKYLSIPVEIQRKNVTTQQIDGEVVCPVGSADNPRNVVAGAVTHLLDPLEFLSRVEEYDFKFIAYSSSSETELYTDSMEELKQEGFTTVLDIETDHQFPTDGYVLRLNSNSEVESLGFTGNYRNGLLAVKTRKEAIDTILLDVQWQVSPKGNVTPVAILEPVSVDGAIVSRATLNNPDFLKILIKEKGLGIGSQVGIIRAGEIIPKIVEVKSIGEYIDIPTNCPCCGTLLAEEGAFLVCNNTTECSSQVAKITQNFFSTLGVKGFGESTAKKFNNLPVEIMKLSETSYIDIMGSTLGKKLYAQVSELKNKNIPQSLLLQAMTIPMVGKQASELLPKLSEWNAEKITTSLGSKKALTERVLFWYNNTFQDIWDGEWPLNTSYSTSTNTSKLTVAVTGTIAGYTRTSLAEMLTKYGVEVSSTVSKKTNYLICDTESTSSSYTKAKSLGIQILTLKSFLEKINHDNNI